MLQTATLTGFWLFLGFFCRSHLVEEEEGAGYMSIFTFESSLNLKIHQECDLLEQVSMYANNIDYLECYEYC